MVDVTGGTPPTGASPFRVPEDFKAVYDHFGDVSMFSVASAANLPTTGNWAGRILLARDTGAVYVWSSGWSVLSRVKSPVGTSVIPTAGAGVTVSANALYLKGGFLLGTIDWAKPSGLAHGETILTLPAGARPEFDVAVATTMTQASTVTVYAHVNAGTSGAVTTLAPPAGKTGGQLRFVMPVAV